MLTECTPTQLEFHALGRRDVVGHFDGCCITSDGDGLLLREVDHRIGLIQRLAQCFTDHRNPKSLEHEIEALVAQRVYGLVLGYEDLNDHERLRTDSMLAVLVGKHDLTGQARERDRDRGYPLAGPSTLNRLELSTPGNTESDRYKRIATGPVPSASTRSSTASGARWKIVSRNNNRGCLPIAPVRRRCAPISYACTSPRLLIC